MADRVHKIRHQTPSLSLSLPLSLSFKGRSLDLPAVVAKLARGEEVW